MRYQSETAKCRERLLHFCAGKGLDLGCGTDKITLHAFGVDSRPLPGVDRVDTINFLDWVPADSQDFIFSSHALEHLEYPWLALKEWLAKIKPGGHLVLYLPHKDHYRDYNPEHHWNPTPLVARGMIGWAAGSLGRRADFVWEYLDVGEDRYSFDLVAQVLG